MVVVGCYSMNHGVQLSTNHRVWLSLGMKPRKRLGRAWRALQDLEEWVLSDKFCGLTPTIPLVSLFRVGNCLEAFPDRAKKAPLSCLTNTSLLPFFQSQRSSFRSSPIQWRWLSWRWWWLWLSWQRALEGSGSEPKCTMWSEVTVGGTLPLTWHLGPRVGASGSETKSVSFYFTLFNEPRKHFSSFFHPVRIWL